MPYPNPFDEPLLIFFPKEGLFPVKTTIVAHFNATEVVHDRSGPSLGSPKLDAIPKVVLDRYIGVREENCTKFGCGSRANTSPLIIHIHHFIPNELHKGILLARAEWVPNL